MSTLLAAATYVGDLGNGLIRRWSTAADQAKIGQLMGTVFRNRPDEALNVRAADEARIFMSEGFPYMGAGDIAIVEDTSKSDSPVVACTCFWRHTWCYGGILFGVDRPENVATAPAYRNRGLVRALMEMFHARSAAEGHLVQAITGIPYYYRQFGYEYVLDLSSYRTIPLTAISNKKPGDTERYQLRLATAEDIPDLINLYNLTRTASFVWHEATEAYWRFHITGWQKPTGGEWDAATVGLNGRLQMIVDQDEQICGYMSLAAKRWGATLELYALQLAAHVNGQAALPALLRCLRQYGEGLPTIEGNNEPFRSIRFALRQHDPIHALLDEHFVGVVDAPYAWYLRVPDLPAFVRHIAPVLEERLARSLLTGYSGELLIDCYRNGLRLDFAAGKLAAAEVWHAPVDSEEAHAGCPPLIFLQLLFGYRSLNDLRAIFPDVWAKPEAIVLVNTLFPKQLSNVYSLSYT
ncbi:MAG: GNAT family N-acetyltransferase [Caldilineaceae bacterium]